MAEKSELEVLLEKNAYGEGLNKEEYGKALVLIRDAEPGEEVCWVCKMNNQDDRSIHDTGLCKGHARYALATRK
ncbi:MAG: hypothetical protein HYV47_03335 [Candidatus Nealsonbacteria bacterium]|nr:hypothetical protein [Candidatus Nealsonbacteria bacterium]